MGNVDPCKATPTKKYHYSLYLDNNWYSMELKPELIPLEFQNPKQALDVMLLNKFCIEPFFKITNESKDPRIDYIPGTGGGIHEIVNRCVTDCVAGIALNPVTVDEVISVADAGKTMPPKSTCFAPKPYTGTVVRIWGRNSYDHY